MMMITDKQVADLCARIYDPSKWPDAPPTPDAVDDWRYFDTGDNDGVCWGVMAAGEVDVVVFRGSTTIPDWLKDLDAWANPWVHDRIGPVHPGFLLGMEQVRDELLDLITHRFAPKPGMADNPLLIAGHSLGAARATILTALMRDALHTPAGRVVFGEPRPGFAHLADIVSKVPGRSYRVVGQGAHDLVTDLPFSFPPEEYVHPTPLVDLPINDPIASPWGLFRLHHVELYANAVR